MSNAFVNVFAGAGGGIVAQIITYPLQTVNTRQLTKRVAKKDLSSSTGPPEQGTMFEMVQVIKSEGLGGLYSGLKPSLLGTAASQGIYYYFYQVIKNKAEAIAASRKKKGVGDGTVGMFSWLIVAAVAGCINVLLTNPIWVVVTHMQIHTQAQRKILERERGNEISQSSVNNSSESGAASEKLSHLHSLRIRPYGTWHAVHEVYCEAGIRGFWKGIIPTLIMVCNPSIQFMIYESSMNHLKAKWVATKNQLRKVTALEVFLLGAIAKLGATVCTYPLLVVKENWTSLGRGLEFGFQGGDPFEGNDETPCTSGKIMAPSKPRNWWQQNLLKYSGTLDAILKMIGYEGLSVFYKGMSTKILQSVFAASVLFMVKEELVKAFHSLSRQTGKLQSVVR